MGMNLYIGQCVGSNRTELSDSKENTNPIESRIKVRILPQMENIDDALCPYYPFFFKDKCVYANKGEYYWVISNEEFTCGYVLGLANYNQYNSSDDFYKINSVQLSPNTDLMEIFQNSVKNIDISIPHSLSNSNIEFWNDSSIHFVNKKTGEKTILFSNGNFYSFGAEEFTVKIGENILALNNNGIQFKNKSNIKLDCEQVLLGNNAVYNALMTNGSSSEGSIVSSHVKVG